MKYINRVVLIAFLYLYAKNECTTANLFIYIAAYYTFDTVAVYFWSKITTKKYEQI